MQRPPHGLCLPCYLRRVIDGHTIVVSLPGSNREWSIGLLDCSAEDLSTVAGKRAREFLVHHLDGQELSVFVPAPANPLNLLGSLVNLGQVLGRVFVGDRDVSDWMVAGGHAEFAKPK